MPEPIIQPQLSSNSTSRISEKFNIHAIKGKAIALTIEHMPCCLLSLTAGLIGAHGLEHNPALELGFAVSGAIAGEYLGHKIFGCGHDRGLKDTIKRYGISLCFGLATWGAHQELFHQSHDYHHVSKEGQQPPDIHKSHHHH